MDGWMGCMETQRAHEAIWLATSGWPGLSCFFHFHFLSSSSSAYSSSPIRPSSTCSEVHLWGSVFHIYYLCRSSKRTLSGCFVSSPGLELGLVEYCFRFNSFRQLCFCSIREWRDVERRKVRAGLTNVRRGGEPDILSGVGVAQCVVCFFVY